MFNFIKNKFLFIIAISALTLIALIIGAVSLHKDNSETFSNEGYILSTTTKKTAKYYFSSNTKYKDNADKKVAFKDTNSKKVSVDPASFVHYNNGSITFLQKGALVNLNEINSPIISYYNVTRNNIIAKNTNSYTITSNGEDINLNSFIGRISDNKYIFAGNNMSLEIPTKIGKINGDYFEVTYIKDGIVKIDNKDISFQVTAQNSFINVGSNIRINLGNEKIYYEGSAKMLLSQITINGDENINLDDNKKNETDTSENNKDNANENGEDLNLDDNSNTTTNSTNNRTGTTNNQENEETNNNQNKKNETSNRTSDTQKNVKIELISADVTSTSINALFQLNNANLIKEKLVATLTNISNGEKEDPISIPAVNGSFNVNKKALLPNTEYNLTITESGKENSKQYFQKTFKTKDLGISLEKQFVTDSSLSYNVKINDNSEVSKVKVTIYDNNGTNSSIEPNEYTITKNNTSTPIEFNNLDSNSSYSVTIDTIWIDNIAYKDLYTINRIDTTLKKTPVISDIEVKANTEEVKFNIKANQITDPDEGIISYTYKIYKSDSINLEGTEPELVYTLTKNDSDAIELDLTKIETMKAGINYRCKIFAQYNDNEMIREIESDYSGNFLIKSKPNISWESTKISADEIKGRLSLIDANCSIPVQGRICLNHANNFTLRYYKLNEGENNSTDVKINFDPTNLIADVDINKNLSSSTAYAFKLYANYYDDNNILHTNVQIGDPFYVTTDESTKVKFKVKKDNESGKDPNGAEIVTFDAGLVKPKDSTVNEETAKITLKLYSGSYDVEEKLIGTYTITEENLIQDFYNNFTITNVLFENDRLGKLDSLAKMISATNNQTRTLNRTYTVEVAEIESINGSTDSIEVEDKLYTFKLTPSYYLDSIIASNPDYKYVSVTTIAKKDLTEQEYNDLSRTVPNLDKLSDDTIVGVSIDNSLSDTSVDSAFTYEKVTVDYIVYNETTNKESKRISINMDNKYQPKSQIIYLDPTELDDGKAFTRGYNYKIGYEIKFVTENGSNPTYSNEKLYEHKEIPKENPTIKQYISTSTNESITYRYSINDIDSALRDKKLYYKIGDSETYQTVNNNLTTDGEYHNVTIPISEKNKYEAYLNTIGTNGSNKYLEFAKYRFESSYEYDNENVYSLVNDNDNTLKIKFTNNDITNRAVAYKVVIEASDDESITKFDKIFLASKLETENTGTEEEPTTTKYISIDYAYLSRFLGHDLKVYVEAYYDSGLVGINQDLGNGFILEKYTPESIKYLNIYNGTKNSLGNIEQSTDKEEDINNSVLMTKNNYELDSQQISIYNYLDDVKNYNKNAGASYYLNKPNSDIVGINYNLSMTKNIYLNDKLQSGGINYNNKYNDFIPKVLKKANIKTTNNNYRFNAIIPKISLKESISTINSINFNITSSGVYGQFIKNNSPHNVLYIDVYSDENLTDKLTTLTSEITINDNTITAQNVEYKNLKPNTSYYATVSAYIDNKLTKLYDIDETTGYRTKTYELKTLDAKGILKKISFHVEPTKYNGESSEKELTWSLELKNKKNYKIRFELFDKDGNPVNFNGSEATSCNLNSTGEETNGYLNGCYIQMPKEKVEEYNGKNNNYKFNGDKFVFGDNYYKLLVYAVPYTNNQYKEDDKLILYQNDSLKTETKDLPKDISYDIKIPTLDNPSFTLNNLISGARCVTEKDSDGNAIRTNGEVVCQNQEEDEFYIEFSLTAKDNYYVIKYGKYSINLKDINDNILETKSNIPVNTINKTFTFTNLQKDTTYNIEIVYEAYRNNNGLTEEEKHETLNQNNYVSTPIDKGITPGNITAEQAGEKKIILNYDQYNMINKITKVNYTIKLNSASNYQTSGEINLGTEQGNSFVVTDTRLKQKLEIDFSSDEAFSLKKGNSYLIITKYYYVDNGVGKWITVGDSVNVKSFTTSLSI